jgi:hypothetical protein
MEHLIILDFSTGNVDIHPVEYSENPDWEEIIESLGHDAGDCQWMTSEGNITFHKEVLK